MRTHHFIVGALGCVLALVGCGAPDAANNVTDNAASQASETSVALAENTASEPVQGEKTYTDVRGQIVKVLSPAQADEPFAVEIDHEEIPDFMKAMRMSIPLQNADDAKMLKAGDKIRCDLLLGKGLTIDNIEMLPADTKLNLAQSAKMESSKTNKMDGKL